MIPFFKPPTLPSDVMATVNHEITQVLRNGVLTNNHHCRELEQQVQERYPAEHVITCSSGTIGLWIALKALRSRSIAASAFTWKSLEHLLNMWTTHWLDIDRHTWLPTIRQEQVDTYLINYTFGNTATYDTITHANMVYDACQAFGSNLTTYGAATVFSLAPTKPFTSCDGGLILTDNKELADKMRCIRDVCARMSEVHAIIGKAYLTQLDNVLKERVAIWQYYQRHLPYQTQIVPCSTSYSVYAMLIEPATRQQITEHLQDKIEHRVYYEPLIQGLPNTDYVYNRILCIPSYAGVEKEKIVEAIKAAA